MKQKKVIHVALVIMFIVTGILSIGLIGNIIALFTPVGAGIGWKFDVVPNIIFHLALLLIMAITIPILIGMIKKETPFCIQNVKKLKDIGIILLLIEPLQFAVSQLLNYYRPLDEMGRRVINHYFYGGAFIAIGLVICCFAYIFEYGNKLQQLSDETL